MELMEGKISGIFIRNILFLQLLFKYQRRRIHSPSLTWSPGVSFSQSFWSKQYCLSEKLFQNVKTIPYLYVFLYIPLPFFFYKKTEIDISTILKHVPRECIYYSIISHIYWCLLCIRLHAETIGCMKQVHAIWVLKSENGDKCPWKDSWTTNNVDSTPLYFLLVEWAKL